MEVKVVEVILVAVPLALPLVIAKEEVQVAKLRVLALSVESVIIKVAKEEEPIMASLPVVKDIAGVLRATFELLIGKVVEGTKVPIMVDLPVVQATVEALLVVTEIPKEKW